MSLRARAGLMPLLALAGLAAAQPAHAAERTILFRSGPDACYHIPGAVQAGDSLVVAAEQRFGYNAAKAAVFRQGEAVPEGAGGPPKGCGDSGFINIVVRRSTDGGRSWEPAHVAVDHANFMAGGYNVAAAQNPTLVAGGGSLHLLFTVVRSRGLRNEPACVSMKPDAAAKCGNVPASYGLWQVISRDGGAHWSAPRPIDVGSDPRRVDRPGPGHGIALASGRLVAPSYDGLLLSDDGGMSWRTGASTRGQRLEGGESGVVALPDGQIWSSARPASRSYRAEGGAPFRVSAYSRDGGASYARVTADTRFPMPPVSAGLLAWGGRVLISYPASDAQVAGKLDMSQRSHLTISWSGDGGRSWHACPVETGSASYSDLLGVDRATAGVVFEGGLGAGEDAARGFQQAIVFRRLPFAALDACGRAGQ